MRNFKALYLFMLCTAFFPSCCLAGALAEGRGQILYEAWPGLSRGDFTDGTGWVDLPKDVQILSEFNFWQRPEAEFTARMSAFVTVPEDGYYTFYTSSKGESLLYLSQDGSSENLKRIVHLDENTNRIRSNQNAWFKVYRQESEIFWLKKGTEVFLTAIHFFFPDVVRGKIGPGRPNHVTVGWSRNGSPVEVIKAEDCRIPWDIWGASAVANPTVFAKGGEFIELEWPRLNLGLGVTSFNVYRDGKLLAVDVKRHRFADKTVSQGKTYSYAVEAVDLLGRVSVLSPELRATATRSVVSAKGTGLTAGFYLPTPERDRDIGNGSYVESFVDATCFLKNRKAEPEYRQGAIPSFQWYREYAIDVPSMTNRPMRMEGFLEAPYEGEWTFTLRASDRVQVWINRRLLFNWQYVADARREFGIHHSTWSIYLKAGEKVPVRIESDYRTVQLEWSHPMFPQGPIPIRYLYPSKTLGTEAFSVISSAESYTNPAHLEIQTGSEVTGVGCGVDVRPVMTIRLDDCRLLVTDSGKLGVKISPDRPTEARFSVLTKSGVRIERTTIRWKPLLLGKDSSTPRSLRVRQGDELLFKDAATGKTPYLVRVASKGGEKDVRLERGRLVFDTPGTFQVTRSGDQASPITVEVIPLMQPPVISLYLGNVRYAYIPDALSRLYVESGDDRLVEIIPFDGEKPSNRLTLRAPNIGASQLIFRERPDGPVLGMIPTDAFFRWNYSFIQAGYLEKPWILCHWIMLFSHVVEGTLIRSEGITYNRRCENGENYQFYEIKKSPDNMFRLPIAFSDNRWGLVDFDFFQGGIRISNDYLGASP